MTGRRLIRPDPGPDGGRGLYYSSQARHGEYGGGGLLVYADTGLSSRPLLVQPRMPSSKYRLLSRHRPGRCIMFSLSECSAGSGLKQTRSPCSFCRLISQIISKEARGITSSVATVVWAPLRFLWYLLCTCGVDDESAEDDYDEDELGMGGVAEEEE